MSTFYEIYRNKICLPLVYSDKLGILLELKNEYKHSKSDKFENLYMPKKSKFRCKFYGCKNKSKIGACDLHRCTFETDSFKCNNVIINDLYKSCKHHLCAQMNFLRKIYLGRTTKIKTTKCTYPRIDNNTPFCIYHGCNVPGCEWKKRNLFNYPKDICDKHICNIEGCRNHTLILNQNHFKTENIYVCPDHICKIENCNMPTINTKTGDILSCFCMKHNHYHSILIFGCCCKNIKNIENSEKNIFDEGFFDDYTAEFCCSKLNSDGEYNICKTEEQFNNVKVLIILSYKNNVGLFSKLHHGLFKYFMKKYVTL